MSPFKFLLCVALFSDVCFGSPVKNLRFLVTSDKVVMPIFGGSANIDCRTNDKTATVTLWKNLLPQGYREVVADGKKVIKQQSGVFTINKVETSDALRYRCKAVKAGVRIQKEVAITINNVRPGIIIKPAQLQRVLTGSSVSFACETQRGLFRWFKEDTKINADGTETTVRRHPVNGVRSKIVNKKSRGLTMSVLSLINTTTTDSGIYECVLRSYGYTIEKNARLNVLAPKVPSFEFVTASKEVNAGDDQILTCHAGGFPEPVITWYKNGEPLQFCIETLDSKCTRAHYIWRKDRQVLKISAVNYIQDNATFTCEAKNQFGNVAADVNLSVLTAPVLDKVNITTVQATSNDYKALSCKVKYSNPEPTFSWKMQFVVPWCYGERNPSTIQICKPDDKNWTNKHMTRWGSFSSSNSIYTPAKYLDMAYFKCTAVNAKGTDSMVFLFRRFRKAY